VEKLERGNLRLKAIVTLMLCAVLAVFLIGATKWSKEVVTETLDIVDEKGNVQATLSGGPDGPRFDFFDPDGKARMGMGLKKEVGPMLYFLDPDGKLNMGMGLGLAEKGHGIVFCDPDGKLSMVMALTEEGAGLAFCDPDGKVRMGMGLSKEGAGISFYDPDEMPRMEMSLSEEGPALDFFDSKGNIIHSIP